MRTLSFVVLSSLPIAVAGSAVADVTWDGARLIRNGLAEWYDDIGGNGVSNVYFEKDGVRLYEGNTPTGGHWLNEDLSAPGVYQYTFKASNNLGNTAITTYNLEFNFNSLPRFAVQATTTSDYTDGAIFTDGIVNVAVELFSFDILPLGAGGVDEVSNLDSTPDGFTDIVGTVRFRVTAVPAPATAAGLGFVALAATRRRR